MTHRASVRATDGVRQPSHPGAEDRESAERPTSSSPSLVERCKRIGASVLDVLLARVLRGWRGRRTPASYLHVHDDGLCEEDGAAMPFHASPHHSAGLDPRYVLVHYAAAPSLRQTVRWFCNRRSGTSAHFVIGRDGEAVQIVPLTRRAWHAGKSRWGSHEDLNAYAIGIELVNAGALQRDAAGRWVDWSSRRIPDRDVVVARHKHEAQERGWHRFPEVQVTRALQIARALHARYGFEDVLGHDDVAPGRKIDPGPAFPMARFASQVLGSSASARDDARA